MQMRVSGVKNGTCLCMQPSLIAKKYQCEICEKHASNIVKGENCLRYSNAEALKEVQIKEKLLREKKYRREISMLGGTSLILTTIMACMLFLFNIGIGGRVTVGRNFGTMLIKAGAGVYVLIAVTAFMAGVLITVLCVKRDARIN